MANKFLSVFVSAFMLASTVLPAYCDDLRSMFQNNEAVIYGLNIRTFNAAEKNNNGIIDFAEGETSGSFINAIDRLDELKSLGINAIHMLPITPVGKIKAMGTAGSLYALNGFITLNLQLSDDNSDLSLRNQAKKFIDECHKRDIKVIVDLPSCGSYDLFLNYPHLFVRDKDGAPCIPADWLDVRLFDVPDTKDELEKSDIFLLHKGFITYMINLGVDGLRADVATIKPFVFWKELIAFAREKKPDFMFLAEASEDWTQKACERAYFTDYKKLLEAGFDGWYGNYFNFKNVKNSDEFFKNIAAEQKVISKYKEKKSVIGSFATHDTVSPLITGGDNFAKMIIWLNATLPLNPYYFDGFFQGDDYMYEYANKKAKESWTDDEYYYVHQGQPDIFNFAGRSLNESDNFVDEQKRAAELRKNFLPQITRGKFVPLKTGNPHVIAYKRTLDKKAVYVVANKNLVNSQNAKISVKYNKTKTKFEFVKAPERTVEPSSKLIFTLHPGETVVFTTEING